MHSSLPDTCLFFQFPPSSISLFPNPHTHTSCISSWLNYVFKDVFHHAWKFSNYPICLTNSWPTRRLYSNVTSYRKPSLTLLYAQLSILMPLNFFTTLSQYLTFYVIISLNYVGCFFFEWTESPQRARIVLLSSFYPQYLIKCPKQW